MRVRTEPASIDDEAPASVRGDRLAVAGVTLLAFVPRALTAGHFQTIDEFSWMLRSLSFSDAITHFHPSAASASRDSTATMPGVTTMWLGSLARWTWDLGGAIGLWSADTSRFLGAELPLRLAQSYVALTCALLVGVIVVLARRWAGRAVAYTAGVLLATEPFLVAHGAVLHTDELTGFFGAAGALGLLVLLDIPGGAGVRAPVGRSRTALRIGTGVLLGGALLTKISALTLAPGLAVLVAVALWTRRDDGATRERATSLAVVAAAALVTVVLLWPALWTDPVGQFRLVNQSAGLAETGHTTFFRGEVTDTPGPTFYAFALPLRMTPWFFVAAPVSVVVALAIRRLRSRAVVLLTIAVPMLVAISVASKQFDRYAIPLVPFLALFVGLAVDAAIVWARDHGMSATAQRVGAGVAVAGIAVYSLLVVPWGLAYFNPLLGGGARAEKTVLVGWGEGLEQFGDTISDEVGDRCDDVTVVATYPLYVALPCGNVVGPGSAQAENADYVIVYINQRQRWTAREAGLVHALVADMHPIERVRERGIDYGTLYAR